MILCATTALPAQAETAAERGYRLLRTKPFLPADFDDEVFEAIWQVWPEPLRSKARKATPAERRRMAFSRYGLMEPPDGGGADLNRRENRGVDFNPREASTRPLGYVDDGKGGWVMNCLACHAGKVAGKVIPGLPNTHFALQTLTEEVRLTKLMLQKKLTHMDLGSLTMPLGTSNGTTNSVIFGIALGALRKPDMEVDRTLPVPRLVHHDMDAPPFWNVKKKTSLYADGFSPKTARPLVQFVLVPSNSAKTVKSWEDDFRDILAWIESVEPPPYPWPINERLAAEGEKLFRKHCSRCHGTYGKDGEYHQKTVPLDIVGTDPVRLHALTPSDRDRMKEGWMSHYGRDPVVVDPVGYVAPPLDGIWASGPYLHNGSVPTLWHLLHPDDRPAVWKRTEEGYDREQIGLEVTTYDELPATAKTGAEQRQFFDTRQPGKSAAGHRFPDVLNEEEKRAVLEYLKSL